MSLQSFLQGHPPANVRPNPGAWRVEASASGGPEEARRWRTETEVPADPDADAMLARARQELDFPTWLVAEGDLVRVAEAGGRVRLFAQWRFDDDGRLVAREPTSPGEVLARSLPMVQQDRARQLFTPAQVRRYGLDWTALWTANFRAGDLLYLAAMSGMDPAPLWQATIACFDDALEWASLGPARSQVMALLKTYVHGKTMGSVRAMGLSLEAAAMIDMLQDARSNLGEPGWQETLNRAMLTLTTSLKCVEDYGKARSERDKARTRNAWAEGLRAALNALDRAQSEPMKWEQSANQAGASAFRRHLPLADVLRVLTDASPDVLPP